MVDPKLSEVVTVQRAFDAENFTGADTPEGKRGHIAKHLMILLGKFGRVEEQVDHGTTDTTILREEVIPDLIVYAAQLAELEGENLAELYQKRLAQVAIRNGTGAESAERAFAVVEVPALGTDS